MNHQAGETEATAVTWLGPSAQIFRTEALAQYSQGQAREGDLLRLTPTWTRWTYWLLVAVVIGGLVGAFVGTTDQYASGPAFVQIPANMGKQTPLVIALLPGYQRPLLHVGMTVRLALTGYRAAYQTLTIEALDDTLLTPAEARQRFSSALTGMALRDEPVVLVRARAPAATFTAEKQMLPYFAGMQGRAEVRVHSERILFTLLPALKILVGDR